MAITFTDLTTHVRYDNSVTGQVFDILKSRVSLRAHPEGFLTIHQGYEMICEVYETDVTLPAHTDVYDLQDQLAYWFQDPPITFTPSSVLDTIDFQTNAALGLVAAATQFTISAYTTNVNTGTEKLVWNDNANTTHPFQLTPPSAAAAISIVSTSANDTALGTGARTVAVSGLDGAYAPLTEIVALNGTTPVTTVGNFLRVNQIVVVTAGTGSTNAGTINATHPTPSQNVGRMDPGTSITSHGWYSVPANYYLLIEDVHLRAGDNLNASVRFKSYARRLATGLRVMSFLQEVTGNAVSNFRQPMRVDGATDFFFTVDKTFGGGAATSYVNLQGLLINTTLL